MVHTRSGGGSEPLTLPDSLKAVAARGVVCPVCYERRNLCCMAMVRCGHGVCIACAPDMLIANLKTGVTPRCPICRESERGNNCLFTYLYEPGFREAAVAMLRRLSHE